MGASALPLLLVKDVVGFGRERKGARSALMAAGAFSSLFQTMIVVVECSVLAIQ